MMGFSMVEFLGDIFQEAKYTCFKDKSILILGYQRIVHSKPLIYSYARRLDLKMDYSMLQTNKLMGGCDVKSIMWTLGFSSVNVMDVSDYEGADIIFDLNSECLPETMKCRYDYIVECGTCEHVFDFSQALINIAKMLKPGGKVYHYLPAHNFINHGYYSLSPAVLQDFYQGNGFDINRLDMLLVKWDENVRQNEYIQPSNLDFAFATVPDYRILKIVSGNFDILKGYRGYVRCIAVKGNSDDDIKKPGQSQWFEYSELDNIQTTLKHDLQLNDNDKMVVVIGKGDETKLLLKVIISMGLQFASRVLVVDNKCEDEIFSTFASTNQDAVKYADVVVIGDTDRDEEIYSQIKYIEKNGARVVHWKEWKPLFWRGWLDVKGGA